MVEHTVTSSGNPIPRKPSCGEPQRMYTTRVSFEAAQAPIDSRDIANPKNPPRIRFSLRHHSRPVAPHLYEVVLELTIIGGQEPRPSYRAEVHQAGIFDLSAIAEVDRKLILDTCCPRALFPFARQHADALVRGGGFPPFELARVDFEAAHVPQQKREASEPVLVLRKFWQAVAHLQRLGGVAPRPTDFHSIHGEALAVAQLSRDALAAADAVLATAPRDQGTLDMLSAVYSMNNVHERTLEVYRLAVSARPGDARAHYNLATSLMFNGDLDGAEHEIAVSIRLQPTFWDAYTVRSQVRGQTAQHNHVSDLSDLLKRFGSQPQAVERLNMALGKEYEDLGEYGHAFRYMAEGNRVGKARRRYDIRKDEQIFDALFRHAPVMQPAASGFDTDEPIFVFGMPRSGTTLLDRILSSHPEVTSAGELKQFGMLFKYVSGSPTEDLIDADTIARSRSLDWHSLGRDYLAATRPITGHKRSFVDKFPHHFLYAGHIANALPNAKLICVRRNPMDTCLGNFRQVFSEASPFHGYACDLLDAGRYYVLFDRLMTQWRETFPGRILEVHYESLVDEQGATTRALLQFCGLPWDPACLSFEQNRAPVATASAVQVRSPIYREALQRWKCYGEQLAPLRELLSRARIEVPIS